MLQNTQKCLLALRHPAPRPPSRTSLRKNPKRLFRHFPETPQKSETLWKLSGPEGTGNIPGAARPSKTLHTFKNHGELIFGSLHEFHVVNSASRNYTWKANILCVFDGVGHYIEKFWGI